MEDVPPRNSISCLLHEIRQGFDNSWTTPHFLFIPQSNKSATMFKEKANEINPLKVLDVAVKRIGNKLAIRRSSTDDADDSERPGDYSSFLLPGPHLDK